MLIKRVLISIIGLLFLISLACSLRYSIYDPFCKQEIVYKPYIRYYNGRLDAVRTGRPFKDLGPGFYHDLKNMEKNVYICINGMAWLYYMKKEVTSHKVHVYEMPELHSFTHHCMLVNGQTGPGKHDTNKELMSILLMGNPQDYRKPSVQLFTAPHDDPGHPEVVNASTGGVTSSAIPASKYNATSLFIFGGYSECILTQGSRSEFRIRTEIPKRIEEETAASFCKLSFEYIQPNLPFPLSDTNLGERFKHADLVRAEADKLRPPLPPTATDSSSPPVAFPLNTPHKPGPRELMSEAKGLLSKDGISIKGCWVPENYTKETLSTIKERMADVFNLTSSKRYLDLEVAKYFDSRDRIPNKVPGGFGPATNDDYWPDNNKCGLDASYNPVAPAVAPGAGPPPVSGSPIGTVRTLLSRMTWEKCTPEEIANDLNAASLLGAISAVNASADTVQEKRRKINDLRLPIQLRLCITEAHLAYKSIDETIELVLGQWAVAYAKIKLILDKFEGVRKANDEAHDLYNMLDTSKREEKAAIDTLNQADLVYNDYLGRNNYQGDMDDAASIVSLAESYSKRLDYILEYQVEEYFERLVEMYRVGIKGGEVSCGPCCDRQREEGFHFPPVRHSVVTIKRSLGTDLVQIENQKVDPTKFENDARKTCGELPKKEWTCASSKPDRLRSCQILKVRMGTVVIQPELAGLGKVAGRRKKRQVEPDALPKVARWRDDVLNLISDIFTSTAGPRIKGDFARNVGSLTKAYLTDYVNGTLPSPTRTSDESKACKALTCLTPSCEAKGDKCVGKRFCAAPPPCMKDNANCTIDSDPAKPMTCTDRTDPAKPTACGKYPSCEPGCTFKENRCELAASCPAPKCGAGECYWKPAVRDRKKIVCHKDDTGENECPPAEITCDFGCRLSGDLDLCNIDCGVEACAQSHVEDRECRKVGGACTLSDFSCRATKCKEGAKEGALESCMVDGDGCVQRKGCRPPRCTSTEADCVFVAGAAAVPGSCLKEGGKPCTTPVEPTCDSGCLETADKKACSLKPVACPEVMCDAAACIWKPGDPEATRVCYTDAGFTIPCANLTCTGECALNRGRCALRCEVADEPPATATPPCVSGDPKQTCKKLEGSTACSFAHQKCSQDYCRIRSKKCSQECKGATEELCLGAVKERFWCEFAAPDCKNKAAAVCEDPLQPDCEKKPECVFGKKCGPRASCKGVTKDACETGGCKFDPDVPDVCELRSALLVCADQKDEAGCIDKACTWTPEPPGTCAPKPCADPLNVDKTICEGNPNCAFSAPPAVAGSPPAPAACGDKKCDDTAAAPWVSVSKRRRKREAFVGAAYKLPEKSDGWEPIIAKLRECRAKKTELSFKRVGKVNNISDYYVLGRLPNGSVGYVEVAHMVEQADNTYDFNWLIDHQWRMFVTTLGICMPVYERASAGVSHRFNALFTQDFLYPLAQEWVRNRDNTPLSFIYGEWYKSEWPRHVMEAAFYYSGDLKYRPPRKLYVNDLNEANFFISGPLAGTQGIY